MKPLKSLSTGSLTALKLALDAYQQPNTDPATARTFFQIMECLVGSLADIDVWALRSQLTQEDIRRNNQAAIRAATPQIHQDLSRLGQQELRVLKLIGEGYQSPEIAQLLNISYHTVSSHKEHLVIKLGLGSMKELTKFAIKNLTFLPS